jgi:hypothetical protein
MTLPQIIAAGLTWLGLDPTKTEAAIAEAWKSAWITFSAFFIAMIVDGYGNGCKTATDFIHYFDQNWLGWAIANVLTPAKRAYDAMQVKQ